MLTLLIRQLSETRWNFVASIITDTVLGLALIAYSVSHFGLSTGETLLWLFIGWLGFTFVEYAVHAWLFHIAPRAMVKGHAKHHRRPKGYDNLPFFGASVIVGAVYLVVVQFLATPHALLFAASIYLGYVAYSGYHFLMHRVVFSSGYGRYMQRFHAVHHARPKKNHGVTTPIWDFVFRTYEPLSNFAFDAECRARSLASRVRA